MASTPIVVVPDDSPLRAASRLKAIWVDLCRRDAVLHDDVEPPLADTIVAALADAFIRPQPLSRLDLAIEPLMDAFTRDAGSAETAMAMIGHLGDAWARSGVERVSAREIDGVSYRMTVVLDRMVLAVAKTAVHRLAAEALTDPLTGIGNRRAFDQALDREAARAARHGGGLAVAMIDLDGLKRVNDTEGHAAGDAALMALADAARRTVRAEDAVYRLGGDEFAIILTDTLCLDEDDLESRIRDSGGPPLSVGLASSPPDDVDHLTELADQRLYERRARR